MRHTQLYKLLEAVSKLYTALAAKGKAKEIELDTKQTVEAQFSVGIYQL